MEPTGSRRLRSDAAPRGNRKFPRGAAGSHPLATFTTWISVNPRRPHGPFSTPIPDHLAPPNGVFGRIARCWFTHAVPQSRSVATSAARSAFDDHTEPESPKWVAFARST